MIDKERLKAAYARFATLADGFSRMSLWALVSLLLLAVVTWLNPAKFGVYLWIGSKLSLAAVMGFSFDVAAFPKERLEDLTDALQQAMAQTRRATLIAASLIAAGLMP